jgi:hypothetical protein
MLLLLASVSVVALHTTEINAARFPVSSAARRVVYANADPERVVTAYGASLQAVYDGHGAPQARTELQYLRRERSVAVGPSLWC